VPTLVLLLLLLVAAVCTSLLLLLLLVAVACTSLLLLLLVAWVRGTMADSTVAAVVRGLLPGVLLPLLDASESLL
jgi:hypothetical protein